MDNYMIRYYFFLYSKSTNYIITYIKYIFIYVFKINSYNFIAYNI